MKSLSQLLEFFPQTYTLYGDSTTAITAPIVESDADLVQGGVFVARAGLSVDGHDFIARAIEHGAAAIIGEKPLVDLPVPYVQVENAQEAVGYLAAAYFDFPSRDLVVIGVTGTDGKTSTSTLLHSILRVAMPNKVGLISTISADLGDRTLDTGFHVTTPGAPMIQQLLRQMRDNGLTHVILEMTSHGLAQGRLNGVDVDVAVVTNVTHEHLDYHGTFENYRAAKARMFQMLGQSYRKPQQPKITILNGDDPNAEFFAAIAVDQTFYYGLSNHVNVRATDIVYRPAYTQFVLNIPHGENRDIHLPLLGEFNVMNALAAITTARALGVIFGAIEKGVSLVNGISGRLERIDEGQAFLAIVDFAHTPNALKNALTTTQKMLNTNGRLIVVFGCAGLRDREKRHLMPEIATRIADISIFTAEDPRTESLDVILQTMADAAVAHGAVEGKDFFRIPDRGAAIFAACQMAQPDDIVIACGKGHEQSMAFGTTEYHWDDRDAMRSALRGEALLTLPTAQK